jgi:gamma-glutamylcyclotransferase
MRLPSSLLKSCLFADNMSASEVLNDKSIPSATTLYFGYGSNLWLEQMAERCPGSKFVGIGRLHNYRWMINERGSANPVPLSPTSDLEDDNSQVWGMVYTLTETDEAILDRKEGVPEKHTKEIHEIEVWLTRSENDAEEKIDVTAFPETRPILLYIDRMRTKDDKPREEYIYRMNRGIADALKVGIPLSYVKKVMRKYIPESSGPVDNGILDIVRAQKQTVNL